MRCEREKESLFGGNFYRETLPALTSSLGKKLTTIFGGHSLPETVSFRSLFLTRLPRAFHDFLPIMETLVPIFFAANDVALPVPTK